MSDFLMWANIGRSFRKFWISLGLLPVLAGVGAFLAAGTRPARFEARMLMRCGEVRLQYEQCDKDVEIRFIESPSAVAASLAVKEMQVTLLGASSPTGSALVTEQLKVAASFIRDTDLVEFKAEAPSPEAAMLPLGEISRALIQRHESRFAAMRDASGYLVTSSVPPRKKDDCRECGASSRVKIRFVPTRMEAAPIPPMAPVSTPPWKFGVFAWGLTVGIVLFLAFLFAGEAEPRRGS